MSTADLSIQAEKILLALLEVRTSSAIRSAREHFLDAFSRNPRIVQDWAKAQGAPILFDALCRVCGVGGLERTVCDRLLRELESHCPMPRLDWDVKLWSHWQVFRGLCRFLRKQYNRAEPEFNRALTLIATLGDGGEDLVVSVHYYLAVCNRRLGHYTRAQQEIQSALDIVKRSSLKAYFLIERARIGLSMGNLDYPLASIEEDLTIALKVFGSGADTLGGNAVVGMAYALLARVYRRRKDGLNEARNMIDKAIGLGGLPDEHRAGFLADRAFIGILSLGPSHRLDEVANIRRDLDEARKLYRATRPNEQESAKLRNYRTFLEFKLTNQKINIPIGTIDREGANPIERSFAYVLACMNESRSEHSDSGQAALEAAKMAWKRVEETEHRRRKALAKIWYGVAWLKPPFYAAAKARECLKEADQLLAPDDYGHVRDDWNRLREAIAATDGDKDTPLFVLRRSDFARRVSTSSGLYKEVRRQFDRAFFGAAIPLLKVGSVNKSQIWGKHDPPLTFTTYSRELDDATDPGDYEEEDGS